MSQPRYEDYAVGWICAIKNEETAAKAMLDEVHEHSLLQPRNDSNVYIRGRVGKHNVVIACLPAGKLGTHSAAITATNMFRTFTELRFSLLVGVGGGVTRDGVSGVQLGDVVVSVPRPKQPAVVQHDYGKTEDGGFVRTHHLNAPPRILLNAINRVQTEHGHGNYGYLRYMSSVPETVRLLLVVPHAGVKAFGGPSDHEKIETNTKRDIESAKPRIFYGVIATGNQLIASAKARDTIAHDIEALCFEMEAAGVMDDFKCLVIRGICDNSDSGKTKEWQGRSALAAAAYAKELLSFVEPEEPMKAPAPVVSTISLSTSLISSVGPGSSQQELKTEVVETSVIPPTRSDSFFVLSRQVIESASVGLGRLVNNTQAPWENYCPHTTSPDEKDIGISIEPRVQEMLEKTRGQPAVHEKFVTMLSRLLAEDTLGAINSVHLTEKSYILPNSPRRFEETCKDPRVREWFTTMIRYGFETYMIVGLHTLSTPATRQNTMSSGEVIVAIQYRKVTYQWFWRRSVDTAFLELSNVWEPTFVTKGSETDDDEIVQAVLQDSVTASDFTDEGDIFVVNDHIIVL